MSVSIGSSIVLVTGATGKVGRTFIQRLLKEPKFDSFKIRALCHNRMLEPHERIETFKGSIEHLETVKQDSTWLDNAKAKFLLNWRPQYDLKKMIDTAWAYQRAEDDVRVVWYPG